MKKFLTALTLGLSACVMNPPSGQYGGGGIEFIWVYFLLGIVITLLPAIIAFARSHQSKWGITILTVLAGWTGIGWIIALIWACSDPNKNQPSTTIIKNYVVQGDLTHGGEYGEMPIREGTPKGKKIGPKTIAPSQSTLTSPDTEDEYECAKCNTPITTSNKYCPKIGRAHV
jgi:hypothetical protein